MSPKSGLMYSFAAIAAVSIIAQADEVAAASSHVVRAGDTLWSISQQHNVSLAERPDHSETCCHVRHGYRHDSRIEHAPRRRHMASSARHDPERPDAHTDSNERRLDESQLWWEDRLGT